MSSVEAVAGPWIVVVMPAYNAAKTLADTYSRLPRIVERVILVDDHSRDDTAALASSLGLKVIRHPHNVGHTGQSENLLHGGAP